MSPRAPKVPATWLNGRPHTVRAVKVARVSLYVSMLATTVTVALQLDSGVGVSVELPSVTEVPLHTQGRWSWWLVLAPLWICDVIAFFSLIFSVFAPIPYIRRLLRTGEARVGDHPSVTELIPILIASFGLITFLVILFVGEVLVAEKLEDHHIILPSQPGAPPTIPDTADEIVGRTLFACLTPFFVILGCYTLVALCLVNWTREILAFVAPTTASLILLALKVDKFVTSLSWWAVFTPLMAGEAVMVALVLLFAYRRTYSHGVLQKLATLCVFLAVCNMAIFTVFLVIVLDNAGPMGIRELKDVPILLMVPLLLAQVFGLFPFVMVLFGNAKKWGVPRTSQELWEVSFSHKGGHGRGRYEKVDRV